MQKRIGNWLSAGALVLAACGGVDDSASLLKSRAALTCQIDTDCGDGYACSHVSRRGSCEPSTSTSSTSTSSRTATFASTPDAPRACRSDADCTGGEECESEHGAAYYCAPHREEGKEDYAADAGAPPEHCRQHGEDEYDDSGYGKGGSADAGGAAECDEEHQGDPTYSDEDSHGGDGGEYDDRSGSNRGPH